MTFTLTIDIDIEDKILSRHLEEQIGGADWGSSPGERERTVE